MKLKIYNSDVIAWIATYGPKDKIAEEAKAQQRLKELADKGIRCEP